MRLSVLTLAAVLLIPAPLVLAQATGANLPLSFGEPVEGDAAGTGAPVIQEPSADPAATTPGLDPSMMGAPLADVPAAVPPTTTTGIVKSYNEKTMMLILANRTVYKMPDDFVDPGLKNGNKVQIDWTQVGATRQASAVTLINTIGKVGK